MNKVLLVVVFAVGLLCGLYFNNNKTSVQPGIAEAPSVIVADVEQKNLSPAVAAALSATTEIAPDDLVKLLGVETPKTQFEDFLAFQKLTQLSPEVIQQILLSLDSSQLELQRKIAWFFAGKFPEQAFQLMENSMGDNNVELARTLFSQLSVNQPEKVFDWL